MIPDDDALDRLRAADPATGTEPDLAAIRAAIARATGVPLDGTAPSGPAPDELAARRRGTRNEWLRMVAAVAAVAVVGTGGYLVASDPGREATAISALPAISLNGGAGSGDSAVGAAAPAAPGPESVASGAARDGLPYGSSFAAYGSGHVVFVGQGLSDRTGSATGYAFDASKVASADDAARLAAALGVTGTPQVQWGSWVVGPNDGSGPTVTLDGSGNLSFYDPGRDPWQCQASSSSGVAGSAEGVLVPPAGVVASVPAVPMPSAPAAPTMVPVPSPSPANPSVCTPGTTPTGDAATARAREALAAVGIDTTGAQVQVDDSNVKGEGNAGAAYVYVSFQQVIDGRLTGVGWSVTLVGDGVQNLNGPLAPLVSLGSYDVISPAAAVDRLNDPRFGASGGGSFTPMVGRLYATTEGSIGVPYPTETSDPGQPPVVPAAPRPGAAISWPVQQVTLVSADLGLALTSTPGGAQLLVPAYALTDSTGATWSVVAVADAGLDFGTK